MHLRFEGIQGLDDDLMVNHKRKVNYTGGQPLSWNVVKRKHGQEPLMLVLSPAP